MEHWNQYLIFPVFSVFFIVLLQFEHEKLETLNLKKKWRPYEKKHTISRYFLNYSQNIYNNRSICVENCIEWCLVTQKYAFEVNCLICVCQYCSNWKWFTNRQRYLRPKRRKPFSICCTTFFVQNRNEAGKNRIRS